MHVGTRSPATKRWLVRAAILSLFVVTATGCLGTWGVRTSYRNYVTSSIGQGEIATYEGVTWTDGPGTGKGPFRWPVEYSAYDDATGAGVVQFAGGVATAAHPMAGGHVLELSFWNPRLEIAGDVGTLIVDVNYRPFESTSPTELPPLEAATDVPFATVDLSGVDLTPDSGGWITITDAPTVGLPAAMQLIGWDAFYGDPVELDPLSVKFLVSLPPSLSGTPKVVVSKSVDVAPGDTITVWGWGFDPTTNLGTRPPLAGQPAGNYVIFGKFADVWQPSAGAPSSARTVVSQKWALNATSRAVLDPTGTSPSFTTIDPTGRWETTVDIAEHAAAGNYGVYTFAGSGAVHTAHELAVPVSFVAR
jgi:hypothetical protein